MNNSTIIAEKIASIDLEFGIYIILTLMGFCLIIFFHRSNKKTNEKAKQRTYIEKQLEKLYYPLMDILNNPLPNLRDEKGLKFDSIKIKKIEPFQQLASDDLKDLIEEFIENASRNRSIDMDKLVDRTNCHITHEDFKEFVEADIERLKEELQLIKNS